MQNLSTRERLAMMAVATALLLLVTGGVLLRSRGNTAGSTPPIRPVTPAASPAPVEVEAEGDGGAKAPGGATPSAPETPATQQRELTVFVTGAVKRPGVYSLRPGSRLYHAVRAAGGFKVNARQDALNLADAVQDADQICVPTKEAVAQASAPPMPRREIARTPVPFVPSAPRATSLPPLIVRGTPVATVVPRLRKPSEGLPRGRVLGAAPVAVTGISAPSSPLTSEDGVHGPAEESVPSPAGEFITVATAEAPPATGGGRRSVSGGASAKFKNPGDGTVNLNTAGDAELQKLPGVGPAMAARIAEYRQQIGRFTDPKQLMDVKGIGEKKYAKMAPFLTVE